MKKELIKILKSAGFLTNQDTDNLIKLANESGLNLQNYLFDSKLITEENLAIAYSKYFDIEYIPAISEKMADPNLLSKIQFQFLRQNIIVPIKYNETITIVTADPFLIQTTDELIALIDKNSTLAVATKTIIIDTINKYYPLEGTKQMIDELEEESELKDEDLDLSQIEDQDIMSVSSQAPIVKLVNHILVQAVKREASDIHIEPFEKEIKVRFRIDGTMYQAFNPPKRIGSALVSRIKIMSNLNIAEKKIPQDGRIEVKITEKLIDIRVSILPVTHGECIVMRLLDKTKTFSALTTLGLSQRDFKVVEKGIEKPNGIIFVSGPTGSGKTTTLYSILAKLNTPDVNLITVEDPVEYKINGINQVQVNAKTGLTFAVALRSILRQDPDIVMIGETRDTETAQIAIQAALTGHLVLSTIHTNSTAATITRLIDMGLEPFLISSSLVIVIAQRLVRKLDPNCKIAYKPTEELLKLLHISNESAEKITFYKAVGCEKCLNTGYKGRLPIFEVMEISASLAQLINKRADAHSIKEESLKEGVTLLIQDGIRKIELGLTSIEEVLAAASFDQSS